MKWVRESEAIKNCLNVSSSRSFYSNFEMREDGSTNNLDAHAAYLRGRYLEWRSVAGTFVYQYQAAGLMSGAK